MALEKEGYHLHIRVERENLSICHVKQTRFVPDLMGWVIRFLGSHLTKAYLSKGEHSGSCYWSEKGCR